MNGKSLIQITKEIFIKTKKPLTFKELYSEVAVRAEMTEKEKEERISSFYTALLTDGNFFFDREKKTWYYASLEKVDEVKKHKIDVDKLESSDEIDGEENAYTEEEDEDFDDTSSKELKKRDGVDIDSPNDDGPGFDENQ